MAPGAEAQIRSFIPDLDHLTLIEEIDVPVDANWKVIQENSIEGYHFDHPARRINTGSAHRFPRPRYRLTRMAWWSYIGPPSGHDHGVRIALEALPGHRRIL